MASPSARGPRDARCLRPGSTARVGMVRLAAREDRGVRPKCGPRNYCHLVQRGSDPTTARHRGQTPYPRLRVGVLTQNVDDLHLRAGTQGLIRLHGSIWELSCWNRCAQGSTPWRDERVPLPEFPPRCPHCGGLARPALVWFGESLRVEDVDAAVKATACDVFLTVGTSAVVYPAAGLVHQAKHHGAFTVRDQHGGDSGLLSCRCRAPRTCRINRCRRSTLGWPRLADEASGLNS